MSKQTEKEIFIKKWSAWWRFQEQHEELTDVFKEELEELISFFVNKNN